MKCPQSLSHEGIICLPPCVKSSFRVGSGQGADKPFSSYSAAEHMTIRLCLCVCSGSMLACVKLLSPPSCDSSLRQGLHQAMEALFHPAFLYKAPCVFEGGFGISPQILVLTAERPLLGRNSEELQRPTRGQSVDFSGSVFLRLLVSESSLWCVLFAYLWLIRNHKEGPLIFTAPVGHFL